MLRVLMPFTDKETHVTFSAEALGRLKTGLQRAGLDSRFFAWPPEGDPNRARQKICGSQSAYAGRAISAVAVDTAHQGRVTIPRARLSHHICAEHFLQTSSLKSRAAHV
jgi:hypothetical protein